MIIELIKMKGFGCFGEPTIINLSDGLTVFVGDNASGKTVALEALSRVFGINREQRAIKRSDFFIPSSLKEEDRVNQLIIEVIIKFPELDNAEHIQIQDFAAIPSCFANMVVTEQDGLPICRVRLEANYEDDGTIEGDIKQDLFWVLTGNENPEDGQKRKMTSFERGLIQVNYIPAARNNQKSQVSLTKSMINRLFRSISWNEHFRQSVEDATEQIRTSFAGEKSVNTINKIITNNWKSLYDSLFASKTELNIINKCFSDVIKQTDITFKPNEAGGESNFDNLSDGQKSLFYLSLTSAVFEIERKLQLLKIKYIEDASYVNDEFTDFNLGLITTPILTIIAIEEPENHLSPYHLSRIVNKFRELINGGMAQVILTSHSPAILSRIEPKEVLHFRLDRASRVSIVNKIPLPINPEDEAKYVRAAVMAYPELYFARFVILVEGDSEQILLPRISLSSESWMEIDRSFIAVVPLGGRHVNHFWKLLTDLDIPYATLLDLDIGRYDGGWGRIKYIIDELLKIKKIERETINGVDFITFPSRDSSPLFRIEEKQYKEIDKRHYTQIECLHRWIRYLEEHGVFFSFPLDIDMAMLDKFTDAYKVLPENAIGPRLSGNTAASAVLGKEGNCEPYNNNFSNLLQLFPWYQYLFLNKSKPSTHLNALTRITNENLQRNAPETLKRLLDYIKLYIEAGVR